MINTHNSDNTAKEQKIKMQSESELKSDIGWPKSEIVQTNSAAELKHLQDQLVVTNEELTAYRKIRDEKEKLVNDWHSVIRSYDQKVVELQKEIDSLSSSYVYCNSDYHKHQLAVRIKEKNQEINDMKQRILIRGQLVPEKLSNRQIKWLEQQIEYHQKMVTDEENKHMEKVAKRLRLENEKRIIINEKNAKYNEIYKIQTELGPKTMYGNHYENDVEGLRLYAKIKLIENEIVRVKMKSKYLDYANRNSLSVDVDDEDALIIDCNEYHQDLLLNKSNGGQGWFVDQECPHRDGDYCSDHCDGWYAGNYRCECGNYKGWRWNDDGWDANDLSKFNIEHESPYGWPETQW